MVLEIRDLFFPENSSMLQLEPPEYDSSHCTHMHVQTQTRINIHTCTHMHTWTHTPKILPTGFEVTDTMNLQ